MRGYFIGLDVAMEVSVAVVVNEKREVISNTKLQTTEEALKGYLKGIPGPKHLVIEECTQAEWIYRIALKVCNSVKICKPFEHQKLSGEYKDDDRDALNLALKLQANDVAEVWHDSGARRQDLMQYAQCYMSVVKECTRAKNRIRAVFRSHGVRGATLAYEKETRAVAIKKLPLAGQRERVMTYGTMLDYLSKLRVESKAALIKQVRKYTLYRRVLKTPAFGEISSAIFAAVVWDPSRFANKRKLWAYSGYSIRTDDSSQYYVDRSTNKISKRSKVKTLGLTRSYHPLLKWIFKRAAVTLSRKQWKEEFQRLVLSGLSPENAKSTLARKVIAIALCLAKNGGDYNENKAFVAQQKA